MNNSFITCANLVKIYRVADLEVVALQGLDLDVARGEMLALVGPSGSGKSTLLSAIGGLDRPSAGQLEVDGQNLLTFNQPQLTRYRREQVGFVWQQSGRNLLPYLGARANVELLMTLAGRGPFEKRRWANELLDAVGMTEHIHKRPAQLSGGQQQRIAIACALANKPKILLADESTGEVDWPTAHMILNLLRELRERYGLTIILVTHDGRVAEQADRTVAIRDGRTSSETVRIADRRPTTDGSHDNRHDLSSIVHRLSSEELVVLDSAGRLQLPGDQRTLAGIGRRARIEIVDGGILIRPTDEASDAPTPAPTSSATQRYRSIYNADDDDDDPPQDAPPKRGWFGRRKA